MTAMEYSKGWGKIAIANDLQLKQGEDLSSNTWSRLVKDCVTKLCNRWMSLPRDHSVLTFADVTPNWVLNESLTAMIQTVSQHLNSTSLRVFI